jgi:hypothetical protein
MIMAVSNKALFTKEKSNLQDLACGSQPKENMIRYAYCLSDIKEMFDMSYCTAN